MCKKVCTNCKKELPIEKFYRRDDRDSFYAWCSDCMISGGREVDYPPKKEHGSGRIYVSLRELD